METAQTTGYVPNSSADGADAQQGAATVLGWLDEREQVWALEDSLTLYDDAKHFPLPLSDDEEPDDGGLRSMDVGEDNCQNNAD